MFSNQVFAREPLNVNGPAARPTSTSPSSKLVYGALLGVAISNAGYNILVKKAITSSHKADALVFSFVRDVLAWPLLQLGALAIDGYKLPLARDVILIAVLGLLGMFGNQFFFIYGMSGNVTATEASVLSQLQPIFAAIFAIIARQVSATWMLMFGVVLTCGGSAVMAEIWTIHDWAGSESIHLLSVVASAFCMALYYVAQKPVLNRYPPLSLVAWSYFFGALWMALATCMYIKLPPDQLAQKWNSINTVTNWTLLIFAVLINSILKYALQSFANKWTGATTLTAWSCLTPMLTGVVAASVPAFHEPLTWAYLGALPVIAGVFLVSIAKERDKAAMAAMVAKQSSSDVEQH